MRQLGIVSSLLTLVAVVMGITTLTAFGFSWWEIVKILVPVGAGVALVSWIVFVLGVRSARWLNRDEEDTDSKG